MTRARGFSNWNPQDKTILLLHEVIQTLEELNKYWPLTNRQIFYRLVAKEVVSKTEKEYNRLCEVINRARRSRLISMDVIRDDGFSDYELRTGFNHKTEFTQQVLRQAGNFMLDRQLNQSNRIIVWCEAGGMVPQLEKVCNLFGVSVKSSGGFDSTTAKHGMANSLRADQHNIVLHIGDFDPSGLCMFEALADDVKQFAHGYGRTVEFFRIAVTNNQIKQYDLPTAPPKESTHQKKQAMTKTTQCEALHPEILAQIITNEIKSRLDMSAYEELIKKEKLERNKLKQHLSGLLNF